MAFLPEHYPEIRPEHVVGARLYSERREMAKALVPPGGRIAEVGVAAGYFSEFLLEELKPIEFAAIDLFTMDQYPVIWGRPQSELFEGKSHLDFYRDKFGRRPGVRVEVGLSHEALERFPDEHFDFIYIDAGHDYIDVKQDADVAGRKLKKDGIIFFNDYTMSDHVNLGAYGVVQAANEFIVNGDWKILGLSLQHRMFCDLAITRNR
jgi:hypothetical protein